MKYHSNTNKINIATIKVIILMFASCSGSLPKKSTEPDLTADKIIQAPKKMVKIAQTAGKNQLQVLG